MEHSKPQLILSNMPDAELAKGLVKLSHDLYYGTVILYSEELLLTAALSVTEAARRLRNGGKEKE